MELQAQSEPRGYGFIHSLGLNRVSRESLDCVVRLLEQGALGFI